VFYIARTADISVRLTWARGFEPRFW